MTRASCAAVDLEPGSVACRDRMPLITRAAARFALVAAALFAAAPALAAEPLPKLGAELSATSVSGLSSGAFMAVQLDVAHSKDIVGAGVVAGGPYACAESAAARAFPFWPTAVGQNASQAAFQCMKTLWGKPDPDALAKRAEELADDGKIDPLDSVKADNIYLFSGDDDQTVERPVVEAAETFFKKIGVDPGNLTLVEGKGGHAFITAEGGVACGLSEEPFVTNCDYNQAKAILGWIYGPLQPASPEPKGKFLTFDQTELTKSGNGFAEEGVIYVPESCESAPGCRIHVALHGCQQARETVGDTFIKDSGFAQVADTNRLIVLFPQIAASYSNPQGCWDWWGYTGLDFLSKNAPQIEGIWAMVERLSEKP